MNLANMVGMLATMESQIAGDKQMPATKKQIILNLIKKLRQLLNKLLGKAAKSLKDLVQVKELLKQLQSSLGSKLNIKSLMEAIDHAIMEKMQEMLPEEIKDSFQNNFNDQDPGDLVDQLGSPHSPLASFLNQKAMGVDAIFNLMMPERSVESLQLELMKTMEKFLSGFLTKGPDFLMPNLGQEGNLLSLDGSHSGFSDQSQVPLNELKQADQDDAAVVSGGDIASQLGFESQQGSVDTTS